MSTESHRNGGFRKRGQSNVLLCHCDYPAALITAQTERNLGKKFFGCHFFKDMNTRCNFFRWLENEYERSILAPGGLLNCLQSELASLKEEVKILHQEVDEKNTRSHGVIFSIIIVILLCICIFLHGSR